MRVCLFLWAGLQGLSLCGQGLVADPPVPREDGITVLAPDRAHFQLRAPAKDHVHLRGDFNGWQISSEFLMNQSTDGGSQK